jgi:hypothetical protein
VAPWIANSWDFTVLNGKAAPNVVMLLCLSHHNYKQKGAAMKKNIAFSLSIQREIEKQYSVPRKLDSSIS